MIPHAVEWCAAFRLLQRNGFDVGDAECTAGAVIINTVLSIPRRMLLVSGALTIIGSRSSSALRSRCGPFDAECPLRSPPGWLKSELMMLMREASNGFGDAVSTAGAVIINAVCF